MGSCYARSADYLNCHQMIQATLRFVIILYSQQLWDGDRCRCINCLLLLFPSRLLLRSPSFPLLFFSLFSSHLIRETLSHQDSPSYIFLHRSSAVICTQERRLMSGRWVWFCTPCCAARFLLMTRVFPIYSRKSSQVWKYKKKKND